MNSPVRAYGVGSGIRLKLRTVVMLIMTLSLMLPILGIGFFRLYENEIVRQTERELVAQAAFISSFLIHAADRSQLETKSVEPKWPGPQDPRGRFQPLEFHTDLTEEPVRGPRPDPIPRQSPPRPEALLFGDFISAFLQTAQKTTLAGMKVLDAQGVQLNKGAGHGQGFGHIFEVKQALSGTPEIVLRARDRESPFPALSTLSRGSGIRMFLAYPVIDSGELLGVVYLSRTPKRPLKQLYIDRTQLISFTLTLVICVILLGMVISILLARPLKRLEQKALTYAAEPFQPLDAIRNPMTFETERVDQELDRMAQKLAERMAALDKFAGYVSHELKNPIAAIRGSLELLEDDPHMPEPSRIKFISNALQSSHRLENLLVGLVELTRAENQERSKEKMSLSDLLTALQQHALLYRIELQYEAHARMQKEYTIEISPTAWQHIVDNLLKNSKKHGSEHVAIHITKAGTRLHIQYIDNGSGISQGNIDKVMQPFFTMDKSSGGTGLGLTLVKTLLEQRGGLIEPIYNPDGAQFEIQLEMHDTSSTDSSPKT